MKRINPKFIINDEPTTEKTAWDTVASHFVEKTGVPRYVFDKIELTKNDLTTLILGEAQSVAGSKSFEEFTSNKAVLDAVVKLYGAALAREEGGY